MRNDSQLEQGSSSCLPEKQELLVPPGICIPATFSKVFRPQANPGDGQMIARIQPLLPDGILAANTLPRHFEFARTPLGSPQMCQLAHSKGGTP